MLRPVETRKLSGHIRRAAEARFDLAFSFVSRLVGVADGRLDNFPMPARGTE
jgi:hypothetical protein